MNKETLKQQENKITPLEIGEMLKSPYVLTVFDFDHTLFNTSGFHRKSFQETLDALERPLVITPDLGATLRGKSDEDILRTLLESSGGVDDSLLEQAVKERQKVLRQLVELEQDLSCYFMPEIQDLIRGLRVNRKKVGIASNSPDGFIHEFIKRANVDGKSIDDLFIKDSIVGGSTIRAICNALAVGNDIHSLNKPNPFSIIYSASNINGEEQSPILYIGDGRVDALSVRGRKNMVGLIINAKEQGILSGEFAGFGNILVVDSIKEVLNEK